MRKQYTPDPHHHTKVIGSDDWWQAECSCGWVSAIYPTEKRAEEEATDHVVAAT
jgi:hypothetical protein